MAAADLTAEQILALEALRDEAAQIRADRDVLQAKAAKLHHDRDVLPATIAYYLGVTPATVNGWLNKHRPSETELDIAEARDWRREPCVTKLALSCLSPGTDSEVAYRAVIALEQLEADGYDVTIQELATYIVKKANGLISLINKAMQKQ